MFFVLIFGIVTALTAEAGIQWDVDETRWISLGAGFRSSFRLIEDGTPSGADLAKDFQVESIRLYLNAQILRQWKLEFNTERESDGKVRILDAVAKLEFQDSFNLWFGRFLPPSDRSNLSGPYFLGAFDFPRVQAYPAIFAGRDDGIAAWGQISEGKFKYQFGAFQGRECESNQEGSLLYTGRFTLNFWDPEPGYYNSSTYFGEKNVLAVGLVGMRQADAVGTAEQAGDFRGWNVDALLEKKLPSEGVLTVEGAYYNYDFGNGVLLDQFLVEGDGFFLLASYLFPQKIGQGRLRPSLRFQRFDPTAQPSFSLTEFGIDYVVRGHEARLSAVYSFEDPEGSNGRSSFLLGLQLQF